VTKAALKLTDRINRIEPSATMAVVAEAEKLRQAGVNVVDLSVGEPHFHTPQHIKDAAIAAINNNFTRYTAVGGTIELKDAIVQRHAQDFGSAYKREEAMASVGGKHVLFNAIQALVDHGDEVILPVPYWVSFKDIVRYAGGNCVLLQSDEEDGFRVTAEMVARLVTADQDDHLEFAVESDRRSDVAGGFDRSCPVGGGARDLGDLGRDLRLPELQRPRVFARVVAGAARSNHRCGITFEDLRHDRMAHGVWALSRGCDRCHAEAAEPVHVQSDFDCAEGSGGCAQGFASLRG
jgi:hypothetical protein